MSTMNSLLSALKRYFLGAAIVFGIFVQTDAHAFTLRVIDDSGQPISAGFRWTVEEDPSYHATPGQATPTPGVPGSHTLGVNIHKSHAPLVNTGRSAGATTAIDVPANKRYFVTVLPDHTSPAGTPPNAQAGWTQSGRGVDPGQESVTVVVHRFEPGKQVPTAQISVLVHNDNQPINGAPDTIEPGLAGFSLLLNDPVGPVMQDAWANPVGTTYLYKCFRTIPATGVKIPQAEDAQGNCINQDLLPTQQPTFQFGPDGVPLVDFLGDGNLFTCPGTTKVYPGGYSPYERANCVDPWTGAPMAVGEAVVRYLNQNKYTIEPIPPRSDPNWSLTATFEGTRGNDVWVRAGEPRFNSAIGFLNWLAFFGFVKNCDVFNGVACPNLTTTLAPPTSLHTITGRVVYAHNQHPPLSPGVTPGLPVPNCFVGVNNLGGADEQIYTSACSPCPDGSGNSCFNITNVPPGTYNLAFWDKAINAIMDFRAVTVSDASPATITLGSGPLGDVAVYGWFGTFMGSVFSDVNGDGFRDNPVAEPGISAVQVNLRFTDGSLYQTTATDAAGNYSFTQVFPWWRFIIPEVAAFSKKGTGFLKTTGMTAVVDDAGLLFSATGLPTGNAALIYPGTGASYASMGINPQIQPDGKPYRTQQGPVLTQAYTPYADFTSRIDWGKAAFAPGENGGIKGIVYYATTRTEEDPSNGTADAWEPAVPNVQVNLYKDLHGDGSLDPGQLPVTTTSTSSFNDNQPTGCVGQSGTLWANPQVYNGVPVRNCAETFRTLNQIRPGIYDGSYSFSGVPAGKYVVQVVPGKGYEVLFWGDRNIEFGDPKIPFLIPPPACVGELREVPLFHTLFPDQQVPTLFPGFASGVTKAPQCDRKAITLADGQTAGADFYLFTFAPRAAHIWGAVFSDLLLEFNPNSPNAGGNFTPSWLPVSIRDHKGVEVARYYTDQWGRFDGLVPTNYDIAPPIPIGLVLSMLHIKPNDPGPINTLTGKMCNSLTDPPGGRCITDPFFNRAFGTETVRENWEFYPGRTTFIDTIVLQIAAMTANRVPLNCDFLDHTPEIYSVDGPSGGPLVSPSGYDRITIRSVGSISVPNPDFNPNLPPTTSNPATISRDHGFGPLVDPVTLNKGSVTVGGVPLIGLEWADDGQTIIATVPAGVKTGELIVIRGNGLATKVGVTLHIDNPNIPVRYVSPPPSNCEGLACRVIQPVIDSSPNGTLIILKPGDYPESLNMWKPVQLQGYGAPATELNGFNAQSNLLLQNAISTQLLGFVADGTITSPPGTAPTFVFSLGAGILVAGCDSVTAACPRGNVFKNATSLIDGLTITGRVFEGGGGILVHSFADNLRISNNELVSNQGDAGGGIRIGTPALATPVTNPTGSSFNPNIVMDHNRISANGSQFQGGGGIAIYGGTDHYTVTKNMICGNFSAVYGGGIGHFGLSVERLAGRQAPDPASRPNLITENLIVSNESFDEGGGIMIGSEPAAPPALSFGAGPVLVNANLIQGNKGGNDGGGIRTLKANGQDVANNPTNPAAWYEIDILNNMIVNNSDADAGGGISLDDTVKSFIINNTIANNDSTSTGSDAFGGRCVEGTPPGQFCPPNIEAGGGGLITSIPQVGGVHANAHSAQLQTASGQQFSNPVLINNIIWHNRSFYWDATINGGLGGLLSITAAGAPTPYWDLAVTGTATAQTMSPTYSILTDGVGATLSATNISGVGADPLFVSEYFNKYQATAAGTALGNFVTATFTPNGLRGDYHLKPILPPNQSPAVDKGTVTGPWSAFVNSLLQSDYDGDPRPLLGENVPAGLGFDIGADEVLALVPHIQVTPTALDFGSVPLLQPVQLVLTLKNLGLKELILSAVQFTGTDAAMFRVSDWTGMNTLKPGETATITVVFKPTSPGPNSATLHITSNDPITTDRTIPVTGNGI